ncbi:uncharacterized protein LOC6543859 [Drosophila erecta]|uniref:Uncharacterized protein n=1 Tax=Drosophila erecta TaxID=7220 RepID=B3NJF0_DROER|nr:uncharacterized protein LOC6543859 [Drosophila erecta]EDV50112.1 uncharacterized protein Dere_GG14756 [Drosophila erecta]
MMSHTVRVFKMMYIVAGILISNAEICDTVDRIQIAPRVDLKPELCLTSGGNSPGSRSRTHSRQNSGSASASEEGSPTKKRRVSVSGIAGGVVRGVTSQVSKRVGHRFVWLSDIRLILKQWRLLALSFNLWTIPNFVLQCLTSYMSKKLLINSDCDMIYK